MGIADADGKKLHNQVIENRTRLRAVEKRHERALETGSPTELVDIGREYAAAVQEHLHAVMAWLSRIEKQRRT